MTASLPPLPEPTTTAHIWRDDNRLNLFDQHQMLAYGAACAAAVRERVAKLADGYDDGFAALVRALA